MEATRLSHSLPQKMEPPLLPLAVPSSSMVNVEQFTPTSPLSPSKRRLEHERMSESFQEQTVPAQRQSSPNPSTVSSLSSLSGTPTPMTLDGDKENNQPPAKRRKLTPEEKEAREREKSERKVKRELDKARRDEEKRKKDEERRQRNEVSEEKKREKELKRQEKEYQKQLEEEEKAKKERAQSRINAFFLKPLSASKADSSPKPPCIGKLTPERMQQIEYLEAASTEDTPSKPPQAASDYEKTFLPFAAPSYSTVAPINHFTWDAEATRLSSRDVEAWIHSKRQSSQLAQSVPESLNMAPNEIYPRGWKPIPTSEIIYKLDAGAKQTFDLTSDQVVKPTEDPQILLRSIPIKFIYFHEDVRPPYVGTLSRFEDITDTRRLARRPNFKIRRELDYDYDSEAEWEEPEEGEELCSDAEDDDESVDDAEELEGFLDDEGAEEVRKPKSKPTTGDMQPISTGLCWEDMHGKLKDAVQGLPINPREFNLKLLPGNATLPIDPFSDSYWPSKAKVDDEDVDGNAENNRVPLQPRPNIAINSVLLPNNETNKISKSKKQLRLLAGQELVDFKQIVDGSDLTKQGLLAIAKKKLPKIPNAILSDTLGTVAVRIGAKEADKRWVILDKD